MHKTDDPSGQVPNDQGLSVPLLTLSHPDDGPRNGSMSITEKRAILATLASDAHTDPNSPGMRQLHSGAVVSIDTVLDALRALDASQKSAHRKLGEHGCLAKSRMTVLSRWQDPVHRCNQDDDEDSAPCLSGALPPRIELELRRSRDVAWGGEAA